MALLLLSMLLGVFLPFASAGAHPQKRQPETAAAKKMDSRLLSAIERYREGGLTAARQDRRAALDIDDQARILVDIRAEVTPALVAAIEATGATVLGQFPKYESVRARIPMAKLETVAERSEVKSIRPADRAINSR